jgi:solute carrier family 15 (peptide/histidine transporter), member 3/4
MVSSFQLWKEEGRELERWEGYADWRNRPAVRKKHGGMLAASFVLGILFNFILISNAKLENMILYFFIFLFKRENN